MVLVTVSDTVTGLIWYFTVFPSTVEGKVLQEMGEGLLCTYKERSKNYGLGK